MSSKTRPSPQFLYIKFVFEKNTNKLKTRPGFVRFGQLNEYSSVVHASSQCYKTFLGGILENLDFPLS